MRNIGVIGKTGIAIAPSIGALILAAGKPQNIERPTLTRNAIYYIILNYYY